MGAKENSDLVRSVVEDVKRYMLHSDMVRTESAIDNALYEVGMRTLVKLNDAGRLGD